MKLRCITNSIRIRLRKSDIQSLLSERKIIDEIHFPNNKKLSYGIALIDGPTYASYEEDDIIIYLNLSIGKEWMSNQDVSLQLNYELHNSKTLKLLIEKDFPCKHTGTDYEDTYYELQPEEHRMLKKEN